MMSFSLRTKRIFEQGPFRCAWKTHLAARQKKKSCNQMYPEQVPPDCPHMFVAKAKDASDC